MPHQAFLSHASENRSLAEAARTALQGGGLRCWMAPDCIPAGASYSEAIMAAIVESRLFVLLFTPEANVSPHVLREVERAVNKSLPIVAVRMSVFAPSPGLEYLLSASQWLDATGTPVAASLDRLVAVSRRLADSFGLDSSPEQRLPPELILDVTTESGFNLAAHALCVSRGALESYLAATGLTADERRVRGLQDDLTEVAVHREPPCPRVFLYPKAGQNALTEETFKQAVGNCLLAAQRFGATWAAVAPTGTTLGFSRTRALAAAVRAYAEYLRRPPGGSLPTIDHLSFTVPGYQEAPFELKQLAGTLRRSVAGEELFREHYRMVREGASSSPPGPAIHLGLNRTDA